MEVPLETTDTLQNNDEILSSTQEDVLKPVTDVTPNEPFMNSLDDINQNITVLNTDVQAIKQDVTSLNSRMTAVESPVDVETPPKEVQVPVTHVIVAEPQMQILEFM